MSKKTILIVDDQPDIIRLIVQEFVHKQALFNVINASNGEIGCTVAKEENPDIILMDWDMPVMDGIEATRHLKQNENTSAIPVIISTGQMTTPRDLQIALEAGAVDYVRKPIDFIELSARINTALRIKEQHAAIQRLLQDEIELKNRKLSTASMLMVEKNTLLHDFGHSLEEIERSCKKESAITAEKIKSLRKRISNHIEIDESWETFKLHFDEVHPHFFQILTEKYKINSHKDLKLCAYVKLGMDNKQISRLLNITPSSARTALTRLKKKLGLKEEDQLRVTLTEIN